MPEVRFTRVEDADAAMDRIENEVDLLPRSIQQRRYNQMWQRIRKSVINYEASHWGYCSCYAYLKTTTRKIVANEVVPYMEKYLAKDRAKARIKELSAEYDDMMLAQDIMDSIQPS